MNPTLTYSRSRRALLVLALTVTSATSLAGPAPRAAQRAEPRVVNVTARRFTFEPAEIEATIGEPIRLVVTSADGVHGLEIKKFKVKKEIPRGGEAVVITFTPSAAGRFPILCSEYCGDGHDDMKGTLIVAARSGEGR